MACQAGKICTLLRPSFAGSDGSPKSACHSTRSSLVHRTKSPFATDLSSLISTLRPADLADQLRSPSAVYASFGPFNRIDFASQQHSGQ